MGNSHITHDSVVIYCFTKWQHISCTNSVQCTNRKREYTFSFSSPFSESNLGTHIHSMYQKWGKTKRHNCAQGHTFPLVQGLRFSSMPGGVGVRQDHLGPIPPPTFLGVFHHQSDQYTHSSGQRRPSFFLNWKGVLQIS